MTYLNPIIGEPLCKIKSGGWHSAAVLTAKGFVVCDPKIVDTGVQMPDAGSTIERCEFRRGHIHIRINLPQKEGSGHACWKLDLISGWIVILPFQDLPFESRAVISSALPQDFVIPNPSVKPLQRVLDAYRANSRRILRLRDALADARLPSPLTLQPTGLHSAPLRIYSGSKLRSLPLPRDHKLAAVLMNWSGEEEIEFDKWPELAPEWIS